MIQQKKFFTPWFFLLPALLLNLLVVTGPTIGTLLMSFTNWTGIGSFQFVGFTQYINLLKDPIFYTALFNNIKWLILFCTIPIAIALVVAVLISKLKRGQKVYRTIFFLPYLLSTALVSQIWDWIYNPFSGIDVLLQHFGVKNPPLWLGDPHLVLYSVAFANIWQWWGFLLVLFLSALSQVDKSVEEAATIDGASSFQRFWHVTIPQIRPTLAMIIMLTMIWSFAVFDYVFIMTNGGPGNSSQVLATYMYNQALNYHNAAYGSAIAAAMAIFSIVIIGLFGFLKKRGWDI